MLSFDGKTIICVQRNLLIISHRIAHVPREALSGFCIEEYLMSPQHGSKVFGV